MQHAPIDDLILELDRLAAGRMADWKVPGAALAVVQDGKVVLDGAYGQRDVEAALPVTTTTQFLTCSITKSFTATAVALLHDEGRLDWTKPVRDYLPEFRLHDPVATGRVTILDLLSINPDCRGMLGVSLRAIAPPADLLDVMRSSNPAATFASPISTTTSATT